MGIYTTRPVQEISPGEFSFLIRGKAIEIADHALFHLSIRQRKVFNEQDLFNMVKKETPRKVYLQENGRYGAYYRKSDGYRKLIMEIKVDRVVIVSFIDMQEIPRYQL